MGAVIAAGLASGVGNDELLERIAQLRCPEHRARPARPRGRALSQVAAEGRPRCGGRSKSWCPPGGFADLSVPLTVTAVDLDTGELVLFGAGAQMAPLVDVLCASCALPMYYPPVVLGGRRYGDGGLRGVVPLEPAAELDVELVLAVDVGPGFDVPPPADRPASLPWFGRTTTRWGFSWPPTPRASSHSGGRT